MAQKILVTGSSGTIGTRLCEKLLDAGYGVYGVDIKPNKWSERVDQITVHADLRHRQELEKLPKNVDMVVHLAANARVYDLVVDPDLAKENFDTIYNTLEFCRKSSIKRFIFSSSREVYGNSDTAVHGERDVSLNNCENPYSASKIAGEALVHAYHRCYGIDYIITRFSNVYGLYDESDRVIPLFIKLTGENRDIEVYGEDKVLDFTYIDDTVSGVLNCIGHFDRVKNDVYNIASSKGVSIIDVARAIREYMGGRNKISVKENRTGEVVKFIADITKAKKMLGYEPKTSFEEGIRASVRWYSNIRKAIKVEAFPKA